MITHATTTLTPEQFRQEGCVFFQGGNMDQHELIMFATTGSGYRVYASQEHLWYWQKNGMSTDVWTRSALLIECADKAELLAVADGLLPLPQYKNLRVDPVLEDD